MPRFAEDVDAAVAWLRVFSDVPDDEAATRRHRQLPHDGAAWWEGAACKSKIALGVAQVMQTDPCAREARHS
jgi:hypothetical protein